MIGVNVKKIKNNDLEKFIDSIKRKKSVEECQQDILISKDITRTPVLIQVIIQKIYLKFKVNFEIKYNKNNNKYYIFINKDIINNIEFIEIIQKEKMLLHKIKSSLKFDFYSDYFCRTNYRPVSTNINKIK